MRMNDCAGDRTEGTPSGLDDSVKCTGFENVKNIIADKLHGAAGVLGKKAEDREDQSGMAQCEKQATEWLDQSSEYIRQFDYEDADAEVREYVNQRPGQSLLIAGIAGLIMGAVFRRR